MALNKTPKEEIKQVIITSLRNKFHNYKPESDYKPFHFRLLGRDRLALYSFIHSLNTAFGSSIFEPVAVALAKNRFSRVQAQYSVGSSIYEECQHSIQKIINQLSLGKNPDKKTEIDLIRNSLKGNTVPLRTIKVDLFLENERGEQFLFDLKTVKPNISNFKDFKRTLLEWIGITLSQDCKTQVNSLIAMPYNPYEPQPYQRWTMKGMLDLDHELKVAAEFWDFIGGDGAYDDLLGCFEIAGMEIRDEIDEYFKKFI